MSSDKKKKNRKFEHESLQDPSSLADYLEALKDGFAKGTLTFSDKEGDITLQPHGLIQFNVKAERRRERVRLEVEFEWKESEAAPAKAEALSIRTTEQDD
jgi:amphi-Trp domain-containing protein